MSEDQAYDVVTRYPAFELRRYPEHLVAEVEVGGSFEGAGSAAFGPLAGYIGGRNQSRRKVAMTAPVVQEQARSERITMTAPVVQEAGEQPERYVVSFVMPAEYTVETLPVPQDPRVRVRVVPGHLGAALRFSGRWSRASYEDHAAGLLQAVAAAGLQVRGPLRFARFDPPWTPWFLRRNEVVVPVAQP
jgi:hypothetical protein